MAISQFTPSFHYLPSQIVSVKIVFSTPPGDALSDVVLFLKPVMSLIQKLSSLQPPLTQELLSQRARDVRREDTDVDNIYKPAADFVTHHANSKGVPNHFILFPALAAVSSFIHPKSAVVATTGYREPPILWTVIAARTGERKSAAMQYVLDAVTEVENMLSAQSPEADASQENEQDDMDRQQSPDTDGEPLPNKFKREVLVMPNVFFSVAKLAELLSTLNSKAFLMFDEMFKFFDTLQASGAQQTDRAAILTMYGGGSFQRSTIKRESYMMSQTQLDLMAALLNQYDVDGLFNRFLVYANLPRKCYLGETKQLPPCCKSLTLVFALVHNAVSKSSNLFTLSNEAYTVYEAFFVATEDNMTVTENENIRGHESKARSQALRMALALHTFYYAVDLPVTTTVENAPSIQTVINKQTMENAIELVKLSLHQKLVFCTVEEQKTEPEEETLVVDADDAFLPEYSNILTSKDNYYVQRMLEDDKMVIIRPSDVVSRKRIPALKDAFLEKNRNVQRPVAAAEACLASLVQAGILQEMQGKKKSGPRIVRQFIRKPWDAIPASTRIQLVDCCRVKISKYEQLRRDGDAKAQEDDFTPLMHLSELTGLMNVVVHRKPKNPQILSERG